MKQLLLLTSIAFTGCANLQLQTTEDKINSDLALICYDQIGFSEEERLAWKKERASLKECLGFNPADIKPEQSQEFKECFDKVYKEYIIPASFSKKEAIVYSDNVKEYLTEFQMGVLNKQELSQSLMARYKEYVNSSKNAGNGSYYNWALCRSNSFKEHTPDSYVAWPDLNMHLAKVTEFANKADKQKLPLREFEIEMNKLEAEFQASERNTIQEIKKVQQQQALINSLNNPIRVEHKQSPTSTFCNVIGSTVMCNQY